MTQVREHKLGWGSLCHVGRALGLLTILLAWGISALVLKRVPFLRDMF